MSKHFNIISKVHHNGGITVDRAGKEYKGAGYAVAVSKDTEIVIREELFSSDMLDRVFKLYAHNLQRDNVYLGIWKDNGKVYLDLSEVIQDKEQAIEAGKQRKQIAIFSFEDLETITLDS